MRRICAQIFSNFPKNIFVQFSPTKIMKTFFWYDLQKRSSCVLPQKVGTIFLNQERLGAILVWIFSGFFPDFWQIKTFGRALTPPTSRIPHHWVSNHSQKLIETVEMLHAISQHTLYRKNRSTLLPARGSWWKEYFSCFEASECPNEKFY